MAFQTLFLLFCGAIPAWTQLPFPPGKDADEPQHRYPDGRDRTQDLLKADHAQTMKDLAAIRKLTEEVEADLEKNDRHVLSLGALKKVEEIEKLAKRIRNRMKRF